MNRMMHQMEIEPEDHDLCKKAFVLAIRDALNVVSGKWKLAIVCTLLSGPKGFADIERLLATISPRMLSRELRELEVNGAITRAGPEQEGRARKYVLTPSGQKLEQVIFMLASWGQEHRALSNGAASDET
ncbi:winged helix-turn-helix transcriptional regulator [Gemmobacter serpentinus]|uniref:winged helix-turn-helix transcriptional regulator n=1 Tax=Gemmobacter serpentinus TaxID=2652247 RepID=UPI001CF6A8E9|nr:helix-turn-helix domain-containing protein [Gemmobacter serpentinus]